MFFSKNKGLQPLLLLPPTMCIPSILNITSQLVLPISLLLFKSPCVPLLHLIYNLDGYVIVATSRPPIVLAQPTYLFFNLLFMVTVPHLKGGLALTHILALTLLTSGKINHETAGAVQFLFYLVGFSSVSACEHPPLHKNGAGNPASSTLETTRARFCRFGASFLCNDSLNILWLAVANLQLVPQILCLLIFD